MRHRFAITILLAAMGVSARGAQLTVKIKPETVAAWDRAAATVEAKIEQTISRPQSYLLLDRDPKLMEAVRRGEIVIQKIDEKELKVPSGLTHYWVGALFDPGARLGDYLAVLLDYDRHREYYAEVTDSKLVSHDGDHYRSQLRIVKKKVLTANLKADFETDVSRPSAGSVYVKTIATRITEIENAGQPEERELAVGEDSGFLWRQNSYWLLQQTGGGVYVELATFSLSRSIPTGLGWVIKPFVTGIPKDTIQGTLEATRTVVRR